MKQNPYQIRIDDELLNEVKASAKKNTEEGEKINVNGEIRRLIRKGLKK